LCQPFYYGNNTAVITAAVITFPHSISCQSAYQSPAVTRGSVNIHMSLSAAQDFVWDKNNFTKDLEASACLAYISIMAL
jgi:hypothetical protein